MKPCDTCEAQQECVISVAAEQPYGIEMFTADDVFVKQLFVRKAGTIIPQHSHMYDHTTMLATGRVLVWADAELLGEFIAPTGIYIKANVKHKFHVLEDNTLLYCIHNVNKEKEVKILAEHQLTEDCLCR